MTRACVLILTLAMTGVSLFAQNDVRLPNANGSVKFAVIGDSGQPGSGQNAVARQMAEWRGRFPFEFVVMVGDNIYGGDDPDDYERKFEIPYRPLLSAGVKFYAALGNHDDASQRMYKHFNMNGEKYYSFKPKDGVRFFAIDSNYVDQKQLEWLDKALAESGSDWKVAFFHHPLYSSGETHGSADLQRELLEPVFVKHGVNVVLAGHEHFYERLKPQKGIQYFTVGSSAKLRKGDLRKTDMTAFGNDRDYAFLLIEIAGDDLHYQAVTDEGRTIDAGSIRRPPPSQPAAR